jgi:hypothetical protein
MSDHKFQYPKVTPVAAKPAAPQGQAATPKR